MTNWADGDSVFELLRKSDAFKAFLAGFTDGRIELALRNADSAESDASSKKMRADGRRLVARITNPTATGLRANPALRELVDAAASSPKAPKEFVARTRRNLKEFDQQ